MFFPTLKSLILKSHTADSLLELLQLTRSRTIYSGIERGKFNSRYELSHIYPVAGAEKIGLLHPLNLVITTKEYNRARRKKAPEIDAYSISRSELDSKWLVNESDTQATVLSKIKRYLGKEVLDQFYLEAKLQKTQHLQLQDKLLKLGYQEAEVEKLDKEELAQLLQSNGARTNLTFSKPHYHSLEVCKIELKRHDKENSELYWIVDTLLNDIKSFSESAIDYPTPDFNKYIELQAWNCLHNEPYSLSIEDAEFNDYFSLDSLPITHNKLDSSTNQRQQYLEGEFNYDDAAFSF